MFIHYIFQGALNLALQKKRVVSIGGVRKIRAFRPTKKIEFCDGLAIKQCTHAYAL